MLIKLSLFFGFFYLLSFMSIEAEEVSTPDIPMVCNTCETQSYINSRLDQQQGLSGPAETQSGSGTAQEQ